MSCRLTPPDHFIDLFSGAGGMRDVTKLINAMTGFIAVVVLGLAVVGVFFR
jgi:hypothetical protein